VRNELEVFKLIYEISSLAENNTSVELKIALENLPEEELATLNKVLTLFVKSVDKG